MTHLAAVCFVILVATYSPRRVAVALLSMSLLFSFSYIFLLSSDYGQERVKLGFAGGNLAKTLNLEIGSLLEFLTYYGRPQVVDDRDYLIRTIALEASGEPDLGKVAVAYVILNRKKSGRWGDNIKAVVTYPGQFEPWVTKREEIEGLSLDDPRYLSAARVADSVLSGQTPDPTAGATHFLNPTIVRGRRGGSLPEWASGKGFSIGNHTFYSPDESRPSPARDADRVTVATGTTIISGEQGPHTKSSTHGKTAGR